MSFKIDRGDKSPLYHRVKNSILERINGGEFETGDMLPTEQEFSDYYGVSRITVKRALLELANEGVVTRRQGKGTFVAVPKLEEDIFRVVSMTDPLVMHEGKSWHHVLSVETVLPDLEVSKWLAITDNSPVLKIERLKVVSEEPLIYERSYIPLTACPGLDTRVIDWRTKLIYQVLQSEYNMQLLRARMFIEPTLMNFLEARFLSSPEGTPAMLWRRVTYTTQETPVEYYKAVVRGDRFKYYIEVPYGSRRETASDSKGSASKGSAPKGSADPTAPVVTDSLVM